MTKEKIVAGVVSESILLTVKKLWNPMRDLYPTTSFDLAFLSQCR